MARLLASFSAGAAVCMAWLRSPLLSISLDSSSRIDPRNHQIRIPLEQSDLLHGTFMFAIQKLLLSFFSIL
jgi:hypothetical protein